jgi:hypothetical protein
VMRAAFERKILLTNPMHRNELRSVVTFQVVRRVRSARQP